jgi:hypothetical protein
VDVEDGRAVVIRLVPRSKLDAANRANEIMLHELELAESTIASLRAQLAKAERTRDGEAARAAYYLRLLTERDQCVVCGHALDVPRDPPCCEPEDGDCAERLAGEGWPYWEPVARAIEKAVRDAQVSNPTIYDAAVNGPGHAIE